MHVAHDSCGPAVSGPGPVARGLSPVHRFYGHRDPPRRSPVPFVHGFSPRFDLRRPDVVVAVQVVVQVVSCRAGFLVHLRLRWASRVSSKRTPDLGVSVPRSRAPMSLSQPRRGLRSLPERVSTRTRTVTPPPNPTPTQGRLPVLEEYFESFGSWRSLSVLRGDDLPHLTRDPVPSGAALESTLYFQSPVSGWDRGRDRESEVPHSSLTDTQISPLVGGLSWSCRPSPVAHPLFDRPLSPTPCSPVPCRPPPTWCPRNVYGPPPERLLLPRVGAGGLRSR